jgi:hypothetical protein
MVFLLLIIFCRSALNWKTTISSIFLVISVISSVTSSW